MLEEIYDFFSNRLMKFAISFENLTGKCSIFERSFDKIHDFLHDCLKITIFLHDHLTKLTKFMKKKKKTLPDFLE